MSAYRCYRCGKYFVRKMSDYRTGTLTKCYDCIDKEVSPTAAPIMDDLTSTINTLTSIGMPLSSVLDSVASSSYATGGEDYNDGGSSGA